MAKSPSLSLRTQMESCSAGLVSWKGSPRCNLLRAGVSQLKSAVLKFNPPFERFNKPHRSYFITVSSCAITSSPTTYRVAIVEIVEKPFLAPTTISPKSSAPAYPQRSCCTSKRAINCKYPKRDHVQFAINCTRSHRHDKDRQP
jgi:hypothetical protein